MQRRAWLAVVMTSVMGAVGAVAHAEARYTAVGTIRSFTADRGAVFIAHEAIPGVMGAMTMSFAVRTTVQLAGFNVGDRVRFTFTVTDDGRRLLDLIERVGSGR